MDADGPRARAARETRRRVVAATTELLLSQGYPRTTIRQVAERAGVSVETIYKGFGGKAGLLKSAYDVAIAGDDEPIPIVDRPEARAAYSAQDPVTAAGAYAAFAATLSERAGPLTEIVLTSRGANEDIEAFAATTDAERLVGCQIAVRYWEGHGWLRTGLDPDRAVDLLWTLISPAVYSLLTARGWTIPMYRQWLEGTLLATVLTSPAQP